MTDTHPTTAPSVDEFELLLAPEAGTAAVADVALVAHEHRETPSSTHEIAGPSLSGFVEHWPLYQDAVFTGVLAGMGLAVLGVFVVLRRAVFATAALSQSAGLGVAVALYANIHWAWALPPALGALLATISVTLLFGVRPRVRVSRESVVGFVFIAASALAVLVGDRVAQEAHDVASILFGSAVLVRPLDLALVGAVTVASLALVVLLERALLFTGFDPDGARVQGVPVRLVEGMLWVLVALAVSVSARALGSLPVFAFVVVPAAAALLLAERVQLVLCFAAVIGAASGGLGYLFAFLLDLPVGASQAATATALAAVVYALAWLRR